MTGNVCQLKEKSPYGSQGTASLSGLLLIVSFCLFSITALGQTKLWDKAYGGNLDDYLYEVLQTSDGGYILGGTTDSGVTGDKTASTNGYADYWIVKLNADGSKAWDKTYGGPNGEIFTSLAKTSDGGYILGGYSNSPAGGTKSEDNYSTMGYDYWVVKIDAAGNVQWDKTYGGNGFDRLEAVQQTSDGGYIVGGTSDSEAGGGKTEGKKGPCDEDSCPGDFWVLKLNSAGNKIWDKTIGGSLDEELKEAMQTVDGGYVLGGHSKSNISGDKTQPRIGVHDFWIVKLTANGAVVWDKTFGGTGGDYLQALDVTADNGVIVGGWTNSPASGSKTENSTSADMWIVKISATGVKQWDRTLGGSVNDILNDLKQTKDGGYILAGSSSSPISGDKTEVNRDACGQMYCNPDYWVVKIDAMGQKEWDKTLGGVGNDVAYSIMQLNDGNYLVGGISNSGVSGDRTDPTRGRHDYWVVKLAADTCTPPTPTIALTGSSTYTGGNSNNLFLGYGSQSVTLTASGGMTYSWSPASGLSSTNTAQTVFTPTQAGVYTFTVSAANGACTATISVTITVVDVRCGPKDNKVMICHNGNTICLAKEAVKAHLKNHPKDRLGACTNGEVMATKAENASVQVYPNPFTSSTAIVVTFTLAQKYTVEVYEGKGKLMERWTGATTKTGEQVKLEWKPKRAESGLFVVKIITKDGVQNRQILRQ